MSDPNSMTDLLAELQAAMDKARGRKAENESEATEDQS